MPAMQPQIKPLTTGLQEGASTELVLVPISDVLRVMPTVAPMLEPAIDQSDGRWGLYDVISAILQGHMHLWLAVDEDIVAAMVTRFIDYPRMRACGLMFIGGKAREMWLDHEDRVCEWAQGQGCAELEGYARKGWLRILPHWDTHWTFITRKI